MKMTNKIQNVIILVSFIAFAVISDILLIHTQTLFSADDVQFHLKRVMEVKDLIYNGHIFSPIAFNYFHGSSVMGMYPYYSLIPLAVLYSVTSSYINSYYIFFMIIIFLSLLLSFWSSLRFSSSKLISYLFSVTYSLSLLFFMNMFYHGDLGLTTSLVFLPLCVFGFLDILNGYSYYYKLSLGILLMSLCHIPSVTITILFIFLWMIINIHIIILNKDIMTNLIKSFFLSLLLTSIIWMPMIQLLLMNRMITPGNTHIPLLTSSFISIVKNVGVLALISIPFLFIKIKYLSKLLKQMFVFSIVFILFSSKLMPVGFLTSFNIFKVINKFQFTSRFLIIPHILLCYLASYIFVKYVNHLLYFKKLLVIIFIMFIIVVQMFGQAYLIHIDFNSNYKLANSYNAIEIGNHLLGNNYMIKDPWIKYLYNGYLKNDDYYPINSKSKVKYIINNECIYNHKDMLAFKHKGYNTFTFKNKHEIKDLELPIVHYNDEHLRIYDNNKYVGWYNNKNYLITLKNVNSGKHKIMIRYIQNIWMKVINCILFIIGIIWILLKSVNRYNYSIMHIMKKEL